ncbi:hypothetical protein [Paraburkholderia kururiensis]|uniref:hypothetical protein n=1 Tax=Paraburkholderia kururiensis TaxID=984307 RepID=UPI0005A825A3|nr:hypothetical protein [Paraburkholderia kururiensis]
MNRWRVLLLILLLTGASLLLRPAAPAWARAAMPCAAQQCNAPAMSSSMAHGEAHDEAHMAAEAPVGLPHHALAAAVIGDSASVAHGGCGVSGHCHVAGQCGGMAACCTAAAAPGFLFCAAPTKVAMLRALPPRSDAAAHFLTGGVERPPRLFLA